MIIYGCNPFRCVSSSFCNEPSKPLSLSISLFFHFISSALCMIASMQCNVIDCTVIETFFFSWQNWIRIIMKLTCKWKWNFKIQLSPSHCWKNACQIESDHYAELYFMLVDRLPTNLRRKLMEQDAQQSHHSHKYSGFMLLPTAKPLVIQQQKKKKNDHKFSYLCGFVWKQCYQTITRLTRNRFFVIDWTFFYLVNSWFIEWCH